MKICRQCGRAKPDDEFIAGKARRVASNCSTCRRRNANKHRRRYYASLPPDKRHTLTARRRAQCAGVVHVPYSREAILARWSHRCAYCDAPADHLDHVMPISRGGADEESNIVPACAACNLAKGARTLAEWAATFG